jgi:DNA-directed RNA polymerase specialized sigma24 family protein
MEKKQLTSNEQLFIQAYEKAFPKVASFIKKRGGTFEAAKDIFQDALVIFYEKKVSEETANIQDDSQYIVGIARHLWFKKYHQDKPLRSLNSLPDFQKEEDTLIVSERVLSFTEVAGKKCLELLKSFYYDKINMKEIANTFGFSGERSATTQKYKCIEKIRRVIKERSLTKEDFYV